MKRYISAGFIILTVLSNGCAGSKISRIATGNKRKYHIKTIGFASQGSVLSDAIAIELSKLGYSIIDVPLKRKKVLHSKTKESTRKKVKEKVRVRVKEIEGSFPEWVEKVKAKGIDAYLIIKNDKLYSASARITSTETGKIIAGVSWQNSSGGRKRGSFAERLMRKGVVEAAEEIAKGLSQELSGNYSISK